MKKKLPEIPVEDKPAMQKVVALIDFELAAAAVIDWFKQPFFPECALHTDQFNVGVTVEDEQEASMNEYVVEVSFMTENRDPDWFKSIAAFSGAVARNLGGEHLRKTSMAVNYTELGYAVLVRCVVPKFKAALLA